jgi:predicted MFS family arabinose efflux permease
LLAVLSWREAWWVTAALVLATVPVVLWLVKDKAAPGQTTGRSGAGSTAAGGYRLKDVLRDPGFWLRLPVLITPAFISTGFVFHQVFIASEKAWPIELMAASYTAYALALVVALLAAGSLVDRFTARRLVPFFLTPLALSAVLLAFAEAQWLVPVYLALMAFGTGLSGVIQGSLWAELYGVRHIGEIRSFAAALTVFSSGLAPAAMGWGFDAGAGVLAIALASAAYCVGASTVAGLARKPRPLTTDPASSPA